MDDAKKPILLAAVIVLVTLAFYLPAVDAGFVFDDDHFLTANPLIHAPDGLRRFWLTADAEDYFPLTSTSLWLEWRLWGKGPTGYHVVNLLLHAASAVLVWRVLKRLNVPGAWLAGLIFGVHPVNVASVAWITERKNALALPLCLLSALLYLRFESSRRWRTYAAALTVFFLALLSKTSVVMLPLVLLGCAWWQRGRVTRKDALRALPFFALAGALAAVELWFHSHHVLTHIAARPEGFFSRTAAAGWSVWFYLYKALLPWKLAMVYPRWNVDPRALAAWLPDLALLAGLALAWRYRRSSWGRPLLFAAGYFIVSLLPVLGVADISFMKYSLVADHWQYVAIIGVIALAVAAGVRGWERLPPTPRKQVVVGLVVLVAALGVLTWMRCDVFETNVTLWSDTELKNPHSYIVEVNLGNAHLADAGSEKDLRVAQAEVRLAVTHYRAAVRLDANEPEAHADLAAAAEVRRLLNEELVRQGKPPETE
jgi:hypothetical protein